MKVYSDNKLQKRYEDKIKSIFIFLESNTSDKKVISCCESLSINDPNFSKVINPYLYRIKLLKKEITEKDIKDLFISEVLTILCPHLNLVKSKGNSACKMCRSLFSWWCPLSLDNLCHYETDKKFDVTLKNGAKFNISPNYTQAAQEYETEDVCLFCGDPEDRQ